MDDTIADVWQQIQQARNAKIENPRPLNQAATQEQIQKLSIALACEIPESLRESLLIHNGSGDSGLEIVHVSDPQQGFQALSTAEMVEHWLKDRQREKEAKAEGDPFSKKPEWIPVFVDGVEGDEQIYLDTADGTILQFNLPASNQIADFRYPNYLTFLKVLEHHTRNELWFEWGNGLDAKAAVLPLKLDDDGIKQLESESKQAVKITFADGKVVTVNADAENLLVNSILDAMKPVKFVRTPALQNPDYEIEFEIGEVDYKIGIKKGPQEILSYSINTAATTQRAGGDPEKLEKIMKAIIPQ